VYFCTVDTCERGVTRAQVALVEKRLRGDRDVRSVRFISKEQALREMKRRQPAAVEALPTNPFPDSLSARPVKGVTAHALGQKVRSGSAGVDTVRWTRDRACKIG
jgi:cell division protein FtsX